MAKKPQQRPRPTRAQTTRPTLKPATPQQETSGDAAPPRRPITQRWWFMVVAMALPFVVFTQLMGGDKKDDSPEPTSSISAPAATATP